MPEAPVSWGELIDKITILEIKRDRLSTEAARANVRRELAALQPLEAGLAPGQGLATLRSTLAQVNAALWEIEDKIRAHEARKDFGRRFVELARAVYRKNDERAALKREINLILASELIEEKSYSG